MTPPADGVRRFAVLLVGLWLVAAAPGRGDVLEQTGPAAFVLGDLTLTPPHAHRAVVPMPQTEAAFRFDGNSNWLETGSEVSADTGAGLSAGAWLALASPPGDLAAVVWLAEGGFLLGLNRWRQPEVRLGTLRAAASDPLPVADWVHLAADWDGQRLRLRVDGREVASVTGDAPHRVAGLLAIGRALDAGFQEDAHPLGALNGLLARVTFRHTSDPVTPGARPEGAPDLLAPESWFRDDPDRPRLAPIGETGWTNEPHALTLRDGVWHLYHQANPNGAYWREIVWGHEVSEDLFTWHSRPPALMPGTGFDRRGVWVGNWIPGRQPPAVLYTGVNGEWSGIGLAVAQPDGGLRRTRVISHATPNAYQDMRDPWIVKVPDGWLMLIGAGTRTRDDAFIFAYRSSDGTHFEPVGRFDTGGAQIPGEYWELPMLFRMEGRWVLMATPVVTGVPARTLYWTGDFDGTRFHPDDVQPRQFDILATFRAPTIHADGSAAPVAIGIVADELRDEPARHAAGWVHVLTPATRLTFCADDPDAICQALVPALKDAFTDTISEGSEGWPGVIDTTRPTLIEAELSVPPGAEVRIGLRRAEDGSDVAALAVEAATGVVRLDYTVGSFQLRGRGAVLVGNIPPSDRLRIALLVDGALVFGSINGRPLGVLAVAGAAGRDRIAFDVVSGEAEVRSFRVSALP